MSECAVEDTDLSLTMVNEVGKMKERQLCERYMKREEGCGTLQKTELSVITPNQATLVIQWLSTSIYY
jgi:hypothetical protein